MSTRLGGGGVSGKTVLGYSTIQISWELLCSGIERAVDNAGEPGSVFSVEALPNIVLGCSGLEAFCNEISSMAGAVLKEYSKDLHPEFEFGLARFEDIVGVSEEACKEISTIREDIKSNTLDRFKKLCSVLGLGAPENYQDLSTLVKVRNGIVHFRACDLRIVSKEGRITYDHDLPDFYTQLKGKKYRGREVVITELEPGEIEWVTRISTPTMALWAMEAVIGAILYVLEKLPEGELKHTVWNAYRPSDENYPTLFHRGLSLLHS